MKLKVTMYTGETYEIPVESYDMSQLNEQRNSNDLNAILIGDYSLSRINIRDIVPIEEEEPIQEAPVEEEEPLEEEPITEGEPPEEEIQEETPKDY